MTDFEVCSDRVLFHVWDFIAMVAEIVVGKPLRSL